MNQFKYLPVLMAVTLLAACSSTPTSSTAASSADASANGSSSKVVPANTASSVAGTNTTAGMLPAYLDPKSPIANQRTIYFEYDDFSVKQNYAALIEQHGKFLLAHPGVKIRIAGQADERGGTEYNLALGQKRAEAVEKALQLYGVKDAQVEPVSWGKEKPKALGHDEAAWAQNRRADLEYPLN